MEGLSPVLWEGRFVSAAHRQTWFWHTCGGQAGHPPGLLSSALLPMGRRQLDAGLRNPSDTRNRYVFDLD